MNERMNETMHLYSLRRVLSFIAIRTNPPSLPLLYCCLGRGELEREKPQSFFIIKFIYKREREREKEREWNSGCLRVDVVDADQVVLDEDVTVDGRRHRDVGLVFQDISAARLTHEDGLHRAGNRSHCACEISTTGAGGGA